MTDMQLLERVVELERRLDGHAALITSLYASLRATARPEHPEPEPVPPEAIAAAPPPAPKLPSKPKYRAPRSEPAQLRRYNYLVENGRLTEAQDLYRLIELELLRKQPGKAGVLELQRRAS